MNNKQYAMISMGCYERMYKALNIIKDEDILEVITEDGEEYIVVEDELFWALDKAYNDYCLQIRLDRIDLDNLDKHYIDKQMVIPVLERMLKERDFSNKYIYDYICKHWSKIENGYDLELLADCLFWKKTYDEDKVLKKRLKKQMDSEGYITIYRGFNDYSREDGNSYTLSKEKAIWFSKRFSKESEASYVNKYKIHITDVLAFITNRGEAEIVALPDSVILLETITDYSDKVKISAGCKIEYIAN